MEMLSRSIVGNPDVSQDGGRVDFGYVGDVGSFPPNLNALYSNPGGYTTWKGPYIPQGLSQDTAGLKRDEWGTAYGYSGGTTLTSTGSGSTITKTIARNTTDYLRNVVNGTITDGADSPPGAILDDSINIRVTIPNGTGSTVSKVYHPDAAGAFSMDSIPVGTHPLRIIYAPSADTLFRYLNVYPRHKSVADYKFSSTYFTSGGGGSPQSIVIRPNGSGNGSQNSNSGCSSNWQCVDEATSDNDGTYIDANDQSWRTDSYAAQDPSATGTIDSVLISMNVKMTSGTNDNARTVIITNSNTYQGAIIDLDSYSSYTVFSTRYLTNPATSSPWTWSEIGNILIGVSLDDDARCTQVWATVYYH
jgi:hypothetical protein